MAKKNRGRKNWIKNVTKNGDKHKKIEVKLLRNFDEKKNKKIHPEQKTQKNDSSYDVKIMELRTW